MPVFLHLRIKVSSENLPKLREFLERAIPIYERPCRLKVRLLQEHTDSTSFLELIEYETVEDFLADQKRVEEDPEQRELIREWRQLLEQPPVVEVWHELS